MEVENMLSEDDTLLLGIQFSGAVTAAVEFETVAKVITGGAPFTGATFQPVADFEAVRESTELVFWQDTTNNRVWVKLVGGTWVGNGTPFAATADPLLYQTSYLNITPAP
jgi:hypothetical protein